ncbi:MAG: sec-independent protein translocase protein TatD DNase family protein [Candidatus Parcubacteria bacterium]|nr:sec-independent protein translocase protein TatD DNase family protein [Candidatus Parcubacteria bacterium]
MINVGTDLGTSRDAVALAERYDKGVYAIVGLHPTDTEGPFELEAFRRLAAHPKVVAIGECGLDYFRLNADPAVRAAEIVAQKEIFLAQIAIANEADKPLMLHIREAYGDALDILKEHARVKGNSHFFAGTIEEAKRFLDLGFTLSFTGVITFAKQYVELVEYVPLDTMHAETDCPFVAPMPHRGKRNEPVFLSEVTDKIARIKKLPLEEVESALLGNAKRFFGIDLA